MVEFQEIFLSLGTPDDGGVINFPFSWEHHPDDGGLANFFQVPALEGSWEALPPLQLLEALRALEGTLGEGRWRMDDGGGSGNSYLESVFLERILILYG
jgi:hypothetical protein